jgi:hypothetical protein
VFTQRGYLKTHMNTHSDSRYVPKLPTFYQPHYASLFFDPVLLHVLVSVRVVLQLERSCYDIGLGSFFFIKLLLPQDTLFPFLYILRNPFFLNHSRVQYFLRRSLRPLFYLCYWLSETLNIFSLLGLFETLEANKKGGGMWTIHKVAMWLRSRKC